MCVCVCVCVCVLATRLCPTLWDPMDCNPSGSYIHGILQARILEWIAISYSNIYIFHIYMKFNVLHEIIHIYKDDIYFNFLLVNRDLSGSIVWNINKKFSKYPHAYLNRRWRVVRIEVLPPLYPHYWFFSK